VARRDDYSERTEKPTALRRRQARQRGQVARSSDLTGTLLVCGSVALGWLFGPGLMKALVGMTSGALGNAGADLGSAGAGLPTKLPAVLAGGTALIGAMALLAALANIAQVGVLVTGQPLRPDPQRISITAGLGRMLSGRSMVRAGLAGAKIVAVTLVGGLTIRSWLGQLAGLSGVPVSAALATAGGMVASLALRLGVVLGVLAGVDYLYQRWQLEQDLKMTRRELLEEQRRTEGDPRWSQRRSHATDQAKANVNEDVG